MSAGRWWGVCQVGQTPLEAYVGIKQAYLGSFGWELVGWSYQASPGTNLHTMSWVLLGLLQKWILLTLAGLCLIFGIGKGVLTNLLFTSQKLLRKHTVLFFFGFINKGEAHSDAGCLSNTPSLTNLSTSLIGVSLCFWYLESLAVIQRYTLL